MAITTDKLEGQWVTLKCDPAIKEEEKTKFFIVPLKHKKYSAIRNKYNYFDKEGKTRYGDINQYIEAINEGLKDVENLIDGNGNQVKFELETVMDKGMSVTRVPIGFIDSLPPIVVYELGGKITRDSELSQETKDDLNSSSPE